MTPARLRVLATVAAAVLVTTLVPALTSVPAPAARAAETPALERPNIVLITTDDQSLTDLAWMPHTRRLLGEAGATFTNMLSPHPLCCPARAEILTGQYAQNNGVRSNASASHGGYGALRDPDSNLASWLHDAGYQTAFVGKFLNEYWPGRSHQPAGWDVWNPFAGAPYHYYGYSLWENGQPTTYRDVHSADMIARRTTDYIQQFAGTDRPFFVWASQVAPHGVCRPSRELTCTAKARPARRHRHLFRGVRAPETRLTSFNEANAADKPRHIRHKARVDPARTNRVFRSRIRALQAVDEGVAAAVATLEATGELDDTLVVFTSDNGYLLGQHRLIGKNQPYEEAMRVPLLVRGPGVPAGVVRTQTAAIVDLAPTFVDAAAAPVTRGLDGASLLPAMTDGAHRPTTYLIQGSPRNARESRRAGWFYRGVRTERYTYVRYPLTGFVELYDRAADPRQLRNVARRPRYAGVLAELRRRAVLLQSCAGESCRVDFGAEPLPLATGAR